MPPLTNVEFVVLGAIMFAGLLRDIRRDRAGVSLLPFFLLAAVWLLLGYHDL